MQINRMFKQAAGFLAEEGVRGRQAKGNSKGTGMQINRMFKQAAGFLVLVSLLALSGVARADDKPGFARQLAGTYILKQDNSSTHSSYIFTESGTVIWSASDQKEFAYAPGGGVWKQVGEHAAAVRIVSFELDDSGVAVIDMEFNFDEDFRTVSGSFTGGIYPPDVDVNNPGKKPTSKLANKFTGVRLSYDGD